MGHRSQQEDVAGKTFPKTEPSKHHKWWLVRHHLLDIVLSGPMRTGNMAGHQTHEYTGRQQGENTEGRSWPPWRVSVCYLATAPLPSCLPTRESVLACIHACAHMNACVCALMCMRVWPACVCWHMLTCMLCTCMYISIIILYSL